MIAQNNTWFFLPIFSIPKYFDLRLVIFKCTLYSSPIFLYSEVARGEHFSGQHQSYLHIFVVFLSKHCADRFFLWWLFLHRRLRSRQRGSFVCTPERLLLSFSGSLPKDIVCFYPNNSKKFCNFFLEPSLSASIQGVNSNFFPSFVTLKQCVTASVCLSLHRSKSLRCFRLWMDSTPIFIDVK